MANSGDKKHLVANNKTQTLVKKPSLTKVQNGFTGPKMTQLRPPAPAKPTSPATSQPSGSGKVNK